MDPKVLGLRSARAMSDVVTLILGGDVLIFASPW